MRGSDDNPKFVGGSFVCVENPVFFIQDKYHLGQQINHTPILREKQRRF
jgi:hypothetical protein